MTYNYSIELALFDIVPLALSAIGLIFVAKTIALLNPKILTACYLSITFIILGGISKVTWKLLVASADINLMFLNNALFILMAPGFTFLTYCLWRTRQVILGQHISNKTWLIPIIITLFFSSVSLYLFVTFPSKRLWFSSLLILLTLANVLFIWHVARHCWQQCLKTSSVLFILSLIGVFALSALARIGDQNEAAQWTAELLNTFNQGCLLLGAWLLYRKTITDKNEIIAK